MGRLARMLQVLRRRGPGFAVTLVGGYLWPRLVAWTLFTSPFARLATALLRRLPRRTPPPFPTATPPEAVVLGRIDNDGRLLPLAGTVPGFDEVDADAFVERYRYGLEVVRHGDAPRVRKDYRGDRAAFLREWASLEALHGTAGVPELCHADPERLRLDKAFVPGSTLRQLLAAAGARILSVESAADPELAGLDDTARIEAVWARGRERFDALPPGLLERLERRLDAIHRAGVTGFSLSFGNVVVEARTGEPSFIDFDAATVHRRRGWAFAAARDRDRGLWNRIYGRDLLTEARVRSLVARLGGAYAPFDLGRGVATWGFWSVDSGTGRWDFLNGPALRGWLEGRRVLDLGSHNGLMPLLMLRAGAREVVALERSPELALVAGELRRLFEWRDMTSYALDVRQADMRAVLDGDWGRFDLVTAYCSLYYLEEDDMARVVRRAAELAPAMVLQAKTDTRAGAGDKARKSSLAFLERLLAENGFPRVETVAPPGYSRPLLLARREGETRAL